MSNGWNQKALYAAEAVPLKFFSGDYSITPRKISVKVMREINSLQKQCTDENGNLEFNETTEEMLKLGLTHGVAKHTLDNPDGTIPEWNDELVAKVMEFYDLAIEIFEIIMEYNAPLEQKTSGTSETSQSGNTNGSNTPEENDSQTELIPTT